MKLFKMTKLDDGKHGIRFEPLPEFEYVDDVNCTMRIIQKVVKVLNHMVKVGVVRTGMDHECPYCGTPYIKIHFKNPRHKQNMEKMLK